MNRIALAVVAGVLVTTVALGGCATTVNEAPSGSGSTGSLDTAGVTGAAEPARPPDGGTIVDQNAPEPTVADTGSAADLLPDLSAEMSRLGSLIAEGGNDDEALARIEQIWDLIRPEIEADRPDLLSGLDATIDMAQIAVDRKRPADADKAYSILADLVDQFDGG